MIRPLSLNRPAEPVRGFTLVELLVVISIIGVLVGLLLPAIQAARESARRLQCTNKLKQIGVALQNYHSQERQFPPGATLPQNKLLEGVSWRVLILPFMEQQALYELIDVQRTGEARNYNPRVMLMDEFICPTAEPQPNDPQTEKSSHYAGVSGAGRNNDLIVLNDPVCGNVHTDGIYYSGSSTKIARITDGTSHTLAIGERTYIFRDWLYGADWYGDPVESICSGASKNIVYPLNVYEGDFKYFKFDPENPDRPGKGMVLNDLQFGSEHPGGASFSFADGSVQFLNDGIDFTIYQDLASKEGGEVARPFR